MPTLSPCFPRLPRLDLRPLGRTGQTAYLPPVRRSNWPSVAPVELSWGCAATAAMISRCYAPSGERDQDGNRWLARARAVLKQCQDPGAVLRGWLATEQRATRAAQPARGAVDPLTEREYAIVRLLPGPMSQRQLASTLFVTPNTLKTHLRAIYRKLGAESRGDAVIRAREQGLL